MKPNGPIRATGPHPRAFYDRDTLDVAVDLVGCTLVHETPRGRASGRIVEVEAYHGEDDPACHAAAGLTPRTEPLYGPAGMSYVYLIYGMYHCLNAVTRGAGEPSAVLIRALEPIEGIDLMRRRRAARRGGDGHGIPLSELTDGPGKLCDALGIDRSHDRLDLTGGSTLTILSAESPATVVWTPRVGIRVATDRIWRCMMKDSPHVSKTRLNRETAPAPRPAPARTE